MSRTYRALPNGRVTRQSKLVKRRHRKQDRPLPFGLQVLPQRLAPTPLNPACATREPFWLTIHYGRSLIRMIESAEAEGFSREKVPGGFEVTIMSAIVGDHVWFHRDGVAALALTRAVTKAGIDAICTRV